jgi:hypothetical protein
MPPMEREDMTLAGRDLTVGRLTARIAMLVGGDLALPTLEQCMNEAGLKEISSSQDMLFFARALSKRGGKLEEFSQILVKEVMDAIVRQANKKLVTAIGKERAQQVMAECMTEANLSNINTPQELLNLALCMISRDGVTKVIGHSLKIQAVLDGAIPSK